MRDLKVYLDSKLKNLKLFSYAQKIVSSFSLPDDYEIPNKKFALDIYAGFVELAKLSDEYKNWGEAEWNNFVTMMCLAFKEKGKSIAVTNALCSISGLILSKPVKITDELRDGDNFVTTVVQFEIKQLGTPFTSRFKELVVQLLPKLYWVHEVSLEPFEDEHGNPLELFDLVTVKVDDSVTYAKNIQANPVIYCENDSVVAGSNSWEV